MNQARTDVDGNDHNNDSHCEGDEDRTTRAKRRKRRRTKILKKDEVCYLH
jgi:hypothetical protein